MLPVSKLARQYKLTNKELLAILRDHGVQVKNEKSTLDPDTVALVESELQVDLNAENTVVASIENDADTSSNTTDGLQITEGATVADLAASPRITTFSPDYAVDEVTGDGKY